MRIQDYALTLFVSFLLTVAFAPLGIGSIIPWSLDWLLMQVLRFVAINFVTLKLGQFLFVTPLKQPEVPRPLNAFDEAIIRSRYNFCSTSTKEIALWESSTFLYYLNLNTIKTISEKTAGPSRLEFSADQKDKEIFYGEGKQLLKDYANELKSNILSKYSAIRILIYPERIYKEKREEIESLISIHALGRIYCIPVVREKLLSELNKLERGTLRDLSKKLSQKVSDEYTLLSRKDKIALKLKRNHVYSCSIPDFLIIDAYGESLSPAVSTWWYEETEPKYSYNRKIIELAEDCFQIIAKKVIFSWESIKWDKFDPSIFSTVPVILKTDREGDFFSKEYYDKWISSVVPEKHPELKEWIDKEEEILAETVKKEKPNRALDVGCGWGRHMNHLLKTGVQFCAGVDVEPSMLRKARELYEPYGYDRVILKLEDGEDISFSNESFDMAICMTNTFGNMKDDTRKKVIKEVYRVLKKGGILVLSVYKDTVYSKSVREKSYMNVGLRPYPSDDPTIIRTQEGLYSKQFTFKDIEKYLRRFKSIEKIDVNEVAFIVIAYK